MHPESKEKMAFVTWSGLYQFVVMPFGLCNVLTTFQWLMEIVRTGLVRDSCMGYINDILVIGETFQDHLENLQNVFDRLRAAGLCLKPQKCSFVKREGIYLGYVVSGDSISPDSAKVAAVREFTTFRSENTPVLSGPGILLSPLYTPVLSGSQSSTCPHFQECSLCVGPCVPESI